MLKDKKLLFLSIVILLELILIVVFLILYLTTKNRSFDPIADDDYSLHEYCQIYDDKERCENEDYYEWEADDSLGFYIDPEIYGDAFSKTYVNILNEVPISRDDFSNFIVLSEYYTDEYFEDPISGENEPSTYYASIREAKTDSYLYPYNLTRSIDIDIPNEGCAVFNFSVDFSSLKSYELKEESCDELN